MTALDYFRTPLDPFGKQKELGLSSAIDSISVLAERVNGVYLTPKLNSAGLLTDRIQSFVLTSLWGNRMDLSIWPVGGSGGQGTDGQSSAARASEAFSSVLEAGQRMILANDILELSTYVECLQKPSRMDIVVDNAGFELFCDLCLADFLIFSGIASKVHMHLKAHPTFVSDAMVKDLMDTITFLQQIEIKSADGTTPTRALGERWARHVAEGRWVLCENFFWVQPQAMWDMPRTLKEEMSASKLVFIKGDANYRRLLGDRHWNLDTPFCDVLSYFPAPICALRTLKAELGCGMPPERTERAAREDKDWLVAGKYGVIQFCDTKSLSRQRL